MGGEAELGRHEGELGREGHAGTEEAAVAVESADAKSATIRGRLMPSVCRDALESVRRPATKLSSASE